MLPAVLTWPNFNPVALQIGRFAIRWYALAYLLAFVLAWFMLRARLRIPRFSTWASEDLETLLTSCIIGVIAGGRLGYVLFYDLQTHLRNPLQILQLWKGGMSFHGGAIGVILALLWFAHSRKVSFLKVADFLVPAVPLGLALGRLGNFINGELWGRPAPDTLSWAMVFPHVDAQPRHPSQIYEMLTEGILLFIAVVLVDRTLRRHGSTRHGYVSAMFLGGYGVARFACEHFREPDAQLGYLSLGLSMGQWLCVPMILGGLGLAAWIRFRPERPGDREDDVDEELESDTDPADKAIEEAGDTAAEPTIDEDVDPEAAEES